MFPTQNVNLDTVTQDEEKTTNNGKSFYFDFKQGDFKVTDGKVQVIENIDSLKIWIEKVLKTEKFKFKIYDGVDYGVSLIELITSDFPIAFIQAEIEREITETLLKNSDIKSVNSFEFTRNKRTLNVAFIVNSVYGEIEQEVIF